jgi:esterase/lipase
VKLIKLKEINEKNKEINENEIKIELPFFVINSSKDAIIECEIDENMTNYHFNFNEQFQIIEDSYFTSSLISQNNQSEDNNLDNDFENNIIENNL